MLKIQKILRGEVERVKYPLNEQGQQEEFAQAQADGIEMELGRTGYYSEHGKAGARWLGSAAPGLGFVEAVSDDAVEGLILEHRAANGEEVHRIHGRMHVVGLELDFSAPKSFSDLYAISSPEVQLRLMEVWNESVADTVARMERDYIRTREGSGEDRHHMLTGGVVVRSYTHFTSRDQDPQLHAHLLMPNLVQERETGRWKGTDTGHLYNNAKALGHFQQARLRELAEQKLGIVWGEIENGVAEIVGVPASYLEATSQRSAVIKQKVAKLVAQGITVDLHMRDEIAMETRRGKELIKDLGRWQQVQRDIAAEHGLDAEAIAALTPGGREVRASGVDLTEIADRLLGASGLTAMKTTFDPGRVLIALTDAGVKAFELDAVIATILADPRAIPISNQLGEKYTTQELVEREEEIISAFTEGIGAADDLAVEPDVVDSVLEGAEIALNEGQLAALREITLGRDATVIVQARAGTGKTTLARFARQVYERVGIGVIGAAPTAQAKRELMVTAGIVNSETLAWLEGYVKDGGRFVDLLPAGVQRGVLLLDEAAMMHTRSAAVVIKQLRAEGMKAVVMGDSRQLQSVQAGGWMGYLHRTYGGPTLEEIVRQRDPDERKALVQLAARKPQNYIQYELRRDRIHEYDLGDADEALQDAAGMAHRQSVEYGYENTLLMSHSNQRRVLLNGKVQAIRRTLGELGEEPLMRSSEGQDLYAGDRVVLKRNDRRLDVDNGMRATIIGVTARDELLISLDGQDGTLRELPIAYVAEHVRLGYASTIYGAQGTTVEHSIIAANPNELNANNGYVAFSRNRESTTIILIGEPSEGSTLTDQLQRSLQRDGEEELATAQRREWEQGLQREIAESEELNPAHTPETESRHSDQNVMITLEPEEHATGSADSRLAGTDSAEEAPVGTPEPKRPSSPRTPVRDEYFAARRAVSNAISQLGEGWARQAQAAHQAKLDALEADQALRETATNEPPRRDRDQRRTWKEKLDAAQAASDAAQAQAELTSEQLARYGDPDTLINAYTNLLAHRDTSSQKSMGLESLALEEEISRQPEYLTQSIGTKPAPGGKDLANWTHTASRIIVDRWKQGITHDEPIPSTSVDQLAEEYLRRVRGLDEGQDQGIGR